MSHPPLCYCSVWFKSMAWNPLNVFKNTHRGTAYSLYPILFFFHLVLRALFMNYGTRFRFSYIFIIIQQNIHTNNIYNSEEYTSMLVYNKCMHIIYDIFVCIYIRFGSVMKWFDLFGCHTLLLLLFVLILFCVCVCGLSPEHSQYTNQKMKTILLLFYVMWRSCVEVFFSIILLSLIFCFVVNNTNEIWIKEDSGGCGADGGDS